MGAEGTKGGAVNRPASNPEIQKFKRSVCRWCHMGGCAPIVVDGECTNEIACRKRTRKWQRDNPPPPPPAPTPPAKPKGKR